MYALNCLYTGFPSSLNWSMTYRSDSELVMPDAKFVLYEHMTMKEREVLKQYRVRSTTPPETANRNTVSSMNVHLTPLMALRVIL